jgi:hypothetical protein
MLVPSSEDETSPRSSCDAIVEPRSAPGFASGTVPGNPTGNIAELTRRTSKQIVLECLLTAQTGCFLVLTLFYAALLLGRPGPHLPTLDVHNNLNAILQLFESFAVDAVTILFVCTGCIDYARLHETQTGAIHNFYQVSILVLPVMTVVNYLATPVGFLLTGTWTSPLAWVINLSSPLLLSPFLEFDQLSRARLFNEPTAVLMTLLLCRGLFPVAKATIDNAKAVIPRHHEALNLVIIVFQTVMGCVLTSVNTRDDHFYYSFRFLLTRFSEYSLGVMCFEYLYLNRIPGLFTRLSQHTRWLTNVLVFIHVLVWASQIDQVQSSNLHEVRCARIAYLAPCMTRFDSVVSRAVPLAFCVVVACINASHNPIPWLWENHTLSQIATVFVFPTAMAFSLLMNLLRIHRVATDVLFLSLCANVVVSWFAFEFLVPPLIVYTDRLLDRLEAYLHRTRDFLDRHSTAREGYEQSSAQA